MSLFPLMPLNFASVEDVCELDLLAARDSCSLFTLFYSYLFFTVGSLTYFCPRDLRRGLVCTPWGHNMSLIISRSGLSDPSIWCPLMWSNIFWFHGRCWGRRVFEYFLLGTLRIENNSSAVCSLHHKDLQKDKERRWFRMFWFWGELPLWRCIEILPCYQVTIFSQSCSPLSFIWPFFFKGFIDL